MIDFGGDFTGRLLADAGIAPGMRVLDVGSGTGDVALRVARLVGEGGSVLGADVSPDAVTGARRRASEAGAGNVAFEVIDVAASAPERELGPFDAITCRRVLMYRSDRIEILRSLRDLLVPDGLIVAQEHDATLAGSSAPLPLHERVRDWIWSTVQHEGADPGTGFALHAVLTRAGYAVEHVRAEAVLQTPGASQPSGTIVRVMLPRIVAAGVATEAEIDVDTLDERLVEERRAAGATWAGEMMFGAWARAPGSGRG